MGTDVDAPADIVDDDGRLFVLVSDNPGPPPLLIGIAALVIAGSIYLAGADLWRELLDQPLFAILVLGLAAAGLFVLVSRRTILSFDAGSRRLRVETSVFGRVIHASTHSFDAIDHLMLKGQRDEHEIIYRSWIAMTDGRKIRIRNMPTDHATHDRLLLRLERLTGRPRREKVGI